MKHYEETIEKILDSLKVDLIRDVRYQGKCYGIYYCVCGQKVKKGYKLKNEKNSKECVVGKKCLQYVANYFGWN